LGAPEPHFVDLCEEPRLANGWVVASSFTATTLAEQGVPRECIQLVPYGVDAEKFPCRDTPPEAATPFRVVWLGSMTQRKGLSYFLEAVAAVPQANLEVLMCGHHAVECELIEGCGLRSIRVLRGLPDDELARVLRASDLFVLPSLAEGFGHAILEAMSSGLAVLTTPSTCGPDVLQNGVHGFIAPIRDAAALAQRITWGRRHRSDLYRMGLAAATQARRFTWEKFRRGIVQAYLRMLEGARP
jgi:glycosyltransferase involved in cell wall biosynthesis